MDSPERRAVRLALDELKPPLLAFIEGALKTSGRSLAGTTGVFRVGREPDMQQALQSMLANWDSLLASRLAPAVRTYLHELRDVRNRWAHEEQFTADEARRALDTIGLVAGALGVSDVPSPATTRALGVTEALGDARARSGVAANQPVPAGPRAGSRRHMTQRDMVRELFRIHGNNEQRLVSEYAAAERRGEVARARNTHHVSAEDYARALLRDARKKGWLTGLR